MRIYSMTATFGKLDHQTLTFKPGLNVIHAPNEWGKSTWCAFLVAMLYGIDTRERTKQGSLADKERYTPWSGSPMSGRMDISWKGRDITIERRTRGRTPFGDFKAYETATGLPVPELTAADCGQVLLGVEKSVFTRSGFIRLTDLPVSEDDALRRRLNALVTTGDESGASDDLEKKLRELKNRCRHNKTGLLPQLEAQRDEVCRKLAQRAQLAQRRDQLDQEQAQVSQQLALLKNHLDAISYAAAQADRTRVQEAWDAAEAAEAVYNAKLTKCTALPEQSALQEQLISLEQLQMQQDDLHAQQLPPLPEKPDVPSAFFGMPPEEALKKAKTDKDAWDRQKRSVPVFLLLAGICLAIGIALLILDWRFALPLGLCAIVLLVAHIATAGQKKKHLLDISRKYGALSPESWISTAESYTEQMADYRAKMDAYTKSKQALEAQKADLSDNTEYFTGGLPLAQCIEKLRENLADYEALARAEAALYTARKHAQALAAMVKDIPAPEQPDTLNLSEEQTRQQLSQAAEQSRQLQLQQGQVLGMMESLGDENALQQQIATLSGRIEKLEDIYTATTVALEALSETAADLQRRFAPRIGKRAQALFARLTGGRYDRLLLDRDLQLHAGAQGEDTLRAGLWRSDGTVDQLYLALRLAVAEELTPHAPLVLDDALVRFDDTRLSLVMALLKEAAEEKQVLLFTCQDRELKYV